MYILVHLIMRTVLCTPVHICHDPDLALALLNNERNGVISASHAALGFSTQSGFLVLADAIGVQTRDAGRISDDLASDLAIDIINGLVRRSFMTDDAQESSMRTACDNSRQFTQRI